ncbi:hypothetical protein [Amycolatopsis suaedae]|uniref:Core-binding (CB) domain-containing protein n=1 Tax=Amycolatopsis suaedae TaxID=2510978 RepID=A0A4Q7J7U7_9PSEU|nr:hypothetical protein [Amycolatopsis suaedae]RZQ62134.1 hypothetical protein EWH70_21405 [Amycolatopsis suaedae]
MTDLTAATGAGLKEFLDRVVKYGEINPSTGNAQRVAATKVLASEADPDGVDIRSLDVERVLDRFDSLNRMNYSTASLATYKTRFRNSVAMYLAWLDGDPTWKNVVKTRRSAATSRVTNVAPTQVVEAEPAGSDRRNFALLEDGSRPISAPIVTYQLPIRPDLLVQIQLPVDLTPDDADRVATFVRSLAFAPSTTKNRSEPGWAGDDRGA